MSPAAPSPAGLGPEGQPKPQRAVLIDCIRDGSHAVFIKDKYFEDDTLTDLLFCCRARYVDLKTKIEFSSLPTRYF